MQRYFLSKSHFKDNYVMIDGEDAKHITKVMRMTPDSQIICCDNEGACYVCILTETGPDNVQAVIHEQLENSAELPVHVSIAHGLPKGDKFELVIQKGTELGAASFLPFQAERSIVKWDKKKEKKRLERWNKISKEASEQSHRQFIPHVSGVQSVSELISRFSSYSHVLIAYEAEAARDEKSRFHSVLSSMEKGDSLLMVTGPEGGFSDREVALMTEAGAVACAFGPRILRSETAPLYGLAAISYHFELSG